MKRRLTLAYIINVLAYIIFFLLFYVTLSHAQTATPTATPTCVPNGLACVTNSQCCSNSCNTATLFPICQVSPTPRPTPTIGPNPTIVPTTRPTPRPVPTSKYPTATATAAIPTPTANPICNLPQSNFGTLTVGCPVIPSGTKGSVNAYDGTDCPFYNNGIPICSSGGGVHQYTATLFLPAYNDCASCILPNTPTLIYTTLGPFGPAISGNISLHAVVNYEIVEQDLTTNGVYLELDSSVDGGNTWTALQSADIDTFPLNSVVGNVVTSSFSVFTELTLNTNHLLLRLIGSSTSSDGGTQITQPGGFIGTPTNVIWAQIFTIN